MAFSARDYISPNFMGASSSYTGRPTRYFKGSTGDPNRGWGRGDGGALPLDGQQAMQAAQGAQGQMNQNLGQARQNAGRVAGMAAPMSAMGNRLAALYFGTYAPLQQRIVANAEIPTQDYIDAAVNQAASTYDAQQGGLARQAAAMGVDLGSGRFQDLQGDWARAKAAAMAGAYGRSRRDVEQLNFGRMMSAAGLGQALPGTVLGAYGSAQGALGQAAGLNMGIGQVQGQLAGEAAGFAQRQAQMGRTQDSFDALVAAMLGRQAALPDAGAVNTVTPGAVAMPPGWTPTMPGQRALPTIYG